MAVEVRHLQRSEVREAEEFFGAGQKGSSAMPHKRNPVGSENISGCARLLRGHQTSAYENVALWHERDISHSSVERIILPDATTLAHYALHRFAGIIEQLTVYDDNMRRNMDATHGLWASQRLLLKLIDTGLNREASYDLVQPLAMQAWNEKRSFREIASGSDELAEHLSPEEIADAFETDHHTRRVDELFERVEL
jgi:adenylosuccinate lyase